MNFHHFRPVTEEIAAVAHYVDREDLYSTTDMLADLESACMTITSTDRIEIAFAYWHAFGLDWNVITRGMNHFPRPTR